MRRDLTGYLDNATRAMDDLDHLLSAEDKKDDGIDTGDLWAIHTILADALGGIQDSIDELKDTIGW